jgi:hypothetical protein
VHFFDVYGPYEIDRVKRDIFRAKQTMWVQIKADEPSLCQAWGCYIFCIQNGENTVPWYVGKTLANQGFRGEVFDVHKLKLYNEIAHLKGKRIMMLFPYMTGDLDDPGRFSKNLAEGNVSISWLEKTLIGMALQQNSNLLNLRDTSLPRSVTVRGVMGVKSKGPRYREVTLARKALGIF